MTGEVRDEVGAGRTGARMTSGRPPCACTTVTRLSSKVDRSTLRRLIDGSTAQVLERRPQEGGRIHAPPVDERLRHVRPRRPDVDPESCPDAGRHVQVDGGDLGRERVGDALEQRQDPRGELVPRSAISTELNASTVRRRTIGSISPPSGRNRTSWRRPESRFRRARRSALASFASRRGLIAFMRRILPGDASPAAYVRLHGRSRPDGRRQDGGDGGGDEGTRTPDPRDANAVLFQLSYIPTEAAGAGRLTGRECSTGSARPRPAVRAGGKDAAGATPRSDDPVG